MQKRPPVLIWSSLAGIILGAIIYWSAAPTPRHQSDAVDRELKKLELSESSTSSRQSSREFRPPIPAAINSTHPKLEIPDLAPRIEPTPLGPETPIVDLLPRRPPAMTANAESTELPNHHVAPVDEEGLSLQTPQELAADAKEDELAKIARKFLTLEIAKKAKALGKKPVRYVAPWVKTELSADKQTAIVFFDARGKSTDCDVHLRLDPVRKKWNVTYVRGGGFGILTAPAQ